MSRSSLPDVSASSIVAPSDSSDARIQPCDSHSLYRPLRTELEEIRVVQLKAGQADTQIECQLLYWPMTDARQRQYESISYCWGNEWGSICVDGIELKIPLSAQQALRQFRRPDRDRYLWIDCICLDQSSDSEKSYQIAKMHHIYANGEQNLVWLGEDDRNCAKLAFEQFKSFQESLEVAIKSAELLDFLLGQTRRATQRSGEIAIDIPSIVDIFQRPLFSRLWVVQEIALARENSVCCGAYQTSMRTIFRAIMWIYHNRLLLPKRASAALSESFWRVQRLSGHADHNIYAGNEYGAQGGPWVWNRLLWNHSQYDTKKARDHIYGLLGMYQYYSGENELPSLLKPDFTQPLAEIYRNATRYAIETTGDLQLLEFVPRYNDCDDPSPWPSWVPKWHRLKSESISEHKLDKFFCAGGNRSYVLDTGVGTVSPDVLVVPGMFVDSATDCQVSKATGPLIEKSYSALQDYIREIWQILGTHYTTLEKDKMRHLARTLIAGISHNHQPASSEDCGGLRCMLDYMSTSSKLPRYSRRVLRKSKSGDAPSTFHHAMRRSTFYRRFFITRSGKMGLGPEKMQINDVAVVLWHSRWPAILRPVEGHATYRFVGFCYVHDVMDGQLAEQYRSRGEEDVQFSIV